MALSSASASALMLFRGLLVISSEKSGQGMIYLPMLIGVVWITSEGMDGSLDAGAGAGWDEIARI